jgi:hypothetical protein
MVIANLGIGYVTPPVGTCLYLACGISKEPLDRVIRPLIPLLLVRVVMLAVVTFVPDLTLVIPRLLYRREPRRAAEPELAVSRQLDLDNRRDISYSSFTMLHPIVLTRRPGAAHSPVDSAPLRGAERRRRCDPMQHGWHPGRNRLQPPAALKEIGRSAYF